MQELELLNRITIHPDVMVGKPTIRQTRLTVEHILKALSAGLTFDQLQADYPFLEPDDVKACLLYASKILASEKVYLVNAA